MKKILFFLSLFFIATNAHARMTIMACEPEWAAMAREIVKDKADVVSATRAVQNPYLEVPRNLAQIKMVVKANMVICTGGGLEDKWLPDLLKRSSNLDIRSKKAVLFASDYLAVKLNIVDKDKRSMARPHLNPYNILKVAEEFNKRMQALDPLNQRFYQSSFEDFCKRFSNEITRLEKSAKALAGMKIIVLNDSWAYLVDWLKLNVVLNVEKEKNGRKTNSFLTRELAKKANDDGAQAIIYADFQVKDDLYAISKEGNIRVIFLPYTAGGMVNTYDLFKVFDSTLERLTIDCSKVSCTSIHNSTSWGEYIDYDKTISKQTY